MPPTVNFSQVSMINRLLHCARLVPSPHVEHARGGGLGTSNTAASKTVDSQRLLISISMSINTIPLSLQRN